MHELKLGSYDEKKKRFKAGGRWVWHLVDPERPAGTLADLTEVEWPAEVLGLASRFALGATMTKHLYQSRRGPRPKAPQLEATDKQVDNEIIRAIIGVEEQFPSYSMAPKTQVIAALRFFKAPTAEGLFAIGDPSIIRAALRSALNQTHPGGANDPAACAGRMMVMSHRD